LCILVLEQDVQKCTTFLGSDVYDLVDFPRLLLDVGTNAFGVAKLVVFEHNLSAPNEMIEAGSYEKSKHDIGIGSHRGQGDKEGHEDGGYRKKAGLQQGGTWESNSSCVLLAHEVEAVLFEVREHEFTGWA
jgi:hypothetical protein